jgi:hypothetical protein
VPFLRWSSAAPADSAVVWNSDQRLLKSGGRVFLDACATAKKHPFSSFTTKYI